MEVVVKCVPSAFKHDITEANIRHAILNWKYDDIFEDDTEKHLLIEFDSAECAGVPCHEMQGFAVAVA